MTKEEKLAEEMKNKQNHPEYLSEFEYQNGDKMKQATKYA